jgi:DNA polymerase-3 subunit gamma/tau
MRGATSPRLLLELMCAQVLLPAAASDERSLLARLERLEAGAVPLAASHEHQDHPERMRPAPQPPVTPASGPAPGAAAPAAHVPAGSADPAGERPRPADQVTPGAQPQTQPQTQPQAPAARTSAAPAGQDPAASAPPPAAAPSPPAAPVRSAPVFTHAPGTAGAPAAPAAPAAARGTVTLEMLRQAWPSVVEAIKSKGRVAAIVIGNASVASFDEGVLTLRFPRQGDVKGFIGSKYEELLKQALNAMYGVNVVIRAVTGGGDAPSGGRRPGPAPALAPSGQPSASPYGQPPAPGQQSGQPLAAPVPSDYPQQAAPPATPGAVPPEQAYAPGPGAAVGGPAAGATAPGGEGTARSFGGPVVPGGDLPPLPPPPSPDDEDFDPDDEDMSVPVSNELTGMALVQRELGGQIIAEFED